eukprot:1389002-Amphidinium_carterae.1
MGKTETQHWIQTIAWVGIQKVKKSPGKLSRCEVLRHLVDAFCNHGLEDRVQELNNVLLLVLPNQNLLVVLHARFKQHIRTKACKVSAVSSATFNAS